MSEDIQEAEETQEAEHEPPESDEPEGGAEEPEGEEDTSQEPAQPAESETEQRARERGWVPREEYTGNPRNWVDAEEYLKSPPKLRQERDSLDAEVKALKKNLELQGKSIEEIRREERERTLKEIKAQQKRAAEEEDWATFDKLDEERDKVARQPEEKKGEQQDADPVIQEWVDENRWFQSDEILRTEAVAVYGRLEQRHPHMDTRERLNRVTEIIKGRYPEDFGIDPDTAQRNSRPQYRRTQKVSGTEARGGNSSKSGAQKGWNDIPADMREQAKAIIGEGKVYKSREEYAKAYHKMYPEG